MNNDTKDALLVASFFFGYALFLAIINRVPVPTVPKVEIDMNRLGFGRHRRDDLIEQEHHVDG